MIKYFLIGILVIFFIYLVIWTVQFYFFSKRQKKVKRVQELRAKGNRTKTQLPDGTKDYWYNLREIEECSEDENMERFYHYFGGVDEGVHTLLVEMYDCGIVRSDELEEIAYGTSSFEDVDLSFLKDIESEMGVGSSSIIQLDEGLSDFFKPKKKPAENVEKDEVIDAAKDMKNDPGIMDLQGTLSEGVEKLIAAVDDEKRKEDEKEEPILPKKEKSVEKARKAREMTANAETRKAVYEKWVGYVSELFEVIRLHADEETSQKIRKSLIDYGYNDVDVLLESPE